MKDFQARGLFGARHVHKKILDIYFPQFEEKNKKHLKLAALGKQAHIKVADFMKNNAPEKKIEGIQLGKLRLEIKKFLKEEMIEMDKIVKSIIGKE